MTAILYPVAANAAAALSRPLGRAARERQASVLAAGPVRFVTEETGPIFATREAALAAYAGRLDEELCALAPEDRWCVLREIVAPERGRRRVPAPVEPTFTEGRRWPAAPATVAHTGFRLSVSYWRLASKEAALEQARLARRRAEAADLDAAALRAMASQPLRPVRPQQPLDVGLFENPAPEAPHILIPDE
ncbi:MAG: hypothetical protein ACHP84_17900 [Caulobacterales bacterium]